MEENLFRSKHYPTHAKRFESDKYETNDVTEIRFAALMSHVAHMRENINKLRAEMESNRRLLSDLLNIMERKQGASCA